jgi:hypothetical protein
VSDADDYGSFVLSRRQIEKSEGFEAKWIPEVAFDFQRYLIEWAAQKGRAAIFSGCGTGKTLMQLTWAENAVRLTNRPVLLLTPLAVSSQTVKEAEKFGIEAKRSSDGTVHRGIVVTNYERLHHFNRSDFGAVVCDESSVLKSFDGTTRRAITEFMRVIQYRLLCTATPSPNDFHELGTSSEALGYLGFMDMLTRFFVNARNNASLGRAWANAGGGAPQWRFRGHAEEPFWQWVCSWARALQKPSDMGFDDGPFALPPLVEREHIVEASKPRDGFLFSMPAVGLAEERAERRQSLKERCEKVAELVDTGEPAVAWCHLNDEGNMLEKMIPGAIQVSGKDSDDAKEEKFNAFSSGEVRVLVTKPIIGAWGLNWQHCAHMTSFASHSFEQYFQSVRRFWRFGQTKTVTVDHVLSSGEARVIANLQRKGEQADKLFASLSSHIAEELQIKRGQTFVKEEEVPSWL